MEWRKKPSKNVDFSLWGNRATSRTRIIYWTIFPFLTHCDSLQQLSIRGRRGLTSNKSFKSLPCQVFWWESSKKFDFFFFLKSSWNCCYMTLVFIYYLVYIEKNYTSHSSLKFLNNVHTKTAIKPEIQKFLGMLSCWQETQGFSWFLPFFSVENWNDHDWGINWNNFAPQYIFCLILHSKSQGMFIIG